MELDDQSGEVQAVEVGVQRGVTQVLVDVAVGCKLLVRVVIAARQLRFAVLLATCGHFFFSFLQS